MVEQTGPYPTFAAWRSDLLLALAQTDAEEPGGYLDLEVIASKKAPRYRAGWVRKAAEFFEARGWITASYSIGSGVDEGVYVNLTGQGLDAAEQLTIQAAEQSPAGSILLEGGGGTMLLETDSENPIATVPASDRVVRLDDNAPGRADAIDALEKIESVLSSGSNDLKLTADERMVFLSEISPLRRRLESKIVRVGEFGMAVTKGAPLVWLVDKFGGTVIGALALAALTALAALAKSLGIG